MIKGVAIDEVKSALEVQSLNLIDVREVDEYTDGHVPGAVNLPLSQLVERYQELSIDTPYHIICRSGGRSAQACDFLDSQGYDVTNIEGGTSAWTGRLER